MKQLTKIAISDAFLKLLETHTIDKITIKDIAEKCEINRQTFYYHFSDIYDLMEWTLDNEIKKFWKLDCLKTMNGQETVKLLFHYLLLKRKLFLNAYDAQNRLYYGRFLYRQIASVVQTFIQSNKKAEKVPEDKLQFMNNIYTKILVDLFLDWLDEGMQGEDSMHLDDYFTFLDGSIDSALYRFQFPSMKLWEK